MSSKGKSPKRARSISRCGIASASKKAKTKESYSFRYFSHYNKCEDDHELVPFFPNLHLAPNQFIVPPVKLADADIRSSIDRLGEGLIHFLHLVQNREGDVERPYYFLCYEFFRAFLCGPYTLQGVIVFSKGFCMIFQPLLLMMKPMRTSLTKVPYRRIPTLNKMKSKMLHPSVLHLVLDSANRSDVVLMWFRVHPL